MHGIYEDMFLGGVYAIVGHKLLSLEKVIFGHMQQQIMTTFLWLSFMATFATFGSSRRDCDSDLPPKINCKLSDTQRRFHRKGHTYLTIEKQPLETNFTFS